MTAPNVAGLLAHPQRLQVFAAVALGARTPADIELATQASASDIEQALRRLQRSTILTQRPDGYEINHEVLRTSARALPAPEPETFGTDDAATEAVLRTFTREGRLVDFPAQWEKKVAVLSYLAERDFVPGRRYPEATVNDILRAWCDGAPIDHVSVRRYLVDAGVLVRENGEYSLS